MKMDHKRELTELEKNLRMLEFNTVPMNESPSTRRDGSDTRREFNLNFDDRSAKQESPSRYASTTLDNTRKTYQR